MNVHKCHQSITARMETRINNIIILDALIVYNALHSTYQTDNLSIPTFF